MENYSSSYKYKFINNSCADLCFEIIIPRYYNVQKVYTSTKSVLKV